MSSSLAATEGQQCQQDKGVTLKSTWGDKFKKNKKKNQIRCMFQNINGFGYKEENSYKAEGIRTFITNNDIDVYAMQEMNTDWRRCKKSFTIWERTRGWFENMKITVSNNLREKNSSPYQSGGTGILCQKDLSLQMIDSGKDPRRLGQWTWQLFKGKNNICLRIISVYFAKPSDFGKRKAYFQQKEALQQSHIVEPPEEVFWIDLWKEVDQWSQQGDQIVIGRDWNVDVTREEFLELFMERGLYPAITGRHGNNAPNTCNRGSEPIDEIFVSANIVVTAAVYLECGEGEGNHRPLWFEMEKNSVLGTNVLDRPQYAA